MIDKTVIASSLLCLLILSASSAPAKTNSGLNSNEDPSAGELSNSSTSSDDHYSTVPPVLDSTVNESDSSSVQPAPDKERLQEESQSLKGLSKARETANDIEDGLERVTEPSRINKDRERERNTRPPVPRREKEPELEEDPEDPAFERRPALLLRFFPDGTAVLISKFQLHLHVKPKQVKFVAEDKEDHYPLELRPGFYLENGKSYEVSYKRLEAIPWTREQDDFDLDESEAYSEEDRPRQNDHELETSKNSKSSKSSLDGRKPYPLRDKLDATMETTTEQGTDTPTADERRLSASQKLNATVGDSQLSVTTDESASSSPEHYDQAQAEPLKVTTASVGSLNSTEASEEPKTTPIAALSSTVSETPVTTGVSTESSSLTTEPTVTTPKCLSFKNQVSLALSTEDNIGNSLLKKNILPTEDCDSAREGDLSSNSIAQLQSSTTEATTTTIATTSRTMPTALPVISRPTAPSYARNQLVPYLASHYSGDPSKPEMVVVTSLPVLIDLKSTGRDQHQPATRAPAWREVTVGVVRDQQGQPLVPPRYNNWVNHLRGLRKAADGKFWNDLTTPRPSHSRQPIQKAPRPNNSRQQIQQAPSSQRINRAFWADLQRQRPQMDQRGGRGDSNDPRRYRSDPPRNYPVQSKNEFQFWRHGLPQGSGNRWNGNGNNVPEYERNGLPRNAPHRMLENYEHQSNQNWSRGNTMKNHRRW